LCPSIQCAGIFTRGFEGGQMIRCPNCRREVYQEDICAACERCIDCVAREGHDGGEDHQPRRLRSGGQVTFPLGEE
jgi:hypothetical protein